MFIELLSTFMQFLAINGSLGHTPGIEGEQVDASPEFSPCLDDDEGGNKISEYFIPPELMLCFEMFSTRNPPSSPESTSTHLHFLSPCSYKVISPLFTWSQTLPSAS